ncbi:MAG TPA: AraC family transcriptional regulator [Thermomicrobiales bacterium]|nr:AraC family transcriptional regulator [Thermomicrobiales bacterium]
MLRSLPSQPGNGSGKTEPDQSLRETSRPTYREFAPPPPLGKHIVCFWRHGATSMPTTVRVIPDGCVDIVWVNDQAPHVAGPMTKPVLYSIDSGTEIVAVRLRPGVAHRLLGESAKALLNQDVPLRDLWPCHRAAPWEEVIAERSESAKLAAIAEAVTSRLRTDGGSDNVVMHVATWMAGHPFASLDELSGLSGLSDRQIRRQFDEAIGYGPKKLQRILRLQRLLWLASHESPPSPNLAHLSFATGYADQSHMTREVVALTGASPRHLLNGAIRSAVSDLFKTTTT